LPYPLLCDPKATLIGAIGFKKADKTQRGVFVVDKAGKVLAVTPGGPAATVDVVKGLVESMKNGAGPAAAEKDTKADEPNAEEPAADEEAKKEDAPNGAVKEDEKVDGEKKDE
jgi:thioredoxin-dependent peroxiredoxin